MRSFVRFVTVSLSTIVLSLASHGVSFAAESPDTLSQQLTQTSIDKEYLEFRSRHGEISPDQYTPQFNAVQQRIADITHQIDQYPIGIKSQIYQQEHTLFNAQIASLRPAWEAEAQKSQEAKSQKTPQVDQALHRKIDAEIQGDAMTAGRFQAARILLHERLLRNETTQQDFDAKDKIAEQEASTLQRKYSAYGPAWASTFSNMVARDAQQIVTDVHNGSLTNTTRPPQVAAKIAPQYVGQASANDSLVSRTSMVEIVAVLIVLTFFFTYLHALSGPVELDLSTMPEPATLLIGRHRFKIYGASGTVMSPTKEREVRTHVSGGGSLGDGRTAPITSSTTTTIHSQFFLKQSNGREREIQLTNVDIALRDGHRLTAVWAIAEEKEKGQYIMFYNHDTKVTSFDPAQIQSIALSPVPAKDMRYLIALALLIVPFILPLIPLVIGFLLLIANLVVMLIVRGVFLSTRKKRLKQIMVKELIPKLVVT